MYHVYKGKTDCMQVCWRLQHTLLPLMQIALPHLIQIEDQHNQAEQKRQGMKLERQYKGQ
jgi:hypothetical protein